MRVSIRSLSDKIIFLCFSGLVVLTPLIYTTATTELFEVPKMLIVYGLSTIILTLTLLKFIVNKKITLPKNPIIYTLLAFLTFQALSTFFSIDKFTSMYGYPTRLNGGLLSQLAYFVIFACALINLDKALSIKLLTLSVITAFVVSLWGIPSHFGYDPNCLVLISELTSTCWQAEFQPTLRIFSTLGQPNWLASHLVLLFPFSLALLTSSQTSRNKVVYSLCSLAIFLAFIFTSSRSGAVGIAIAVLIFATLLGKKYISKHLKILVPIGVVVLITTVIFGNSLWQRIKEIPSGQAVGGTETGRIRSVVWDGAWQVFLNNPILGTGPETFAFSYQKLRPEEANTTTEWNFFYNKAHNEFLNYLANIGLPGTTLYLILIFLFLRTVYKNTKDKDVESQLLSKGGIAAIVGYQTVIFFGFSVVTTQTLMYSLVAALIAMGKPDQKEINFKLSRLGTIAFSSLTLVLGLWLITVVFRLYFADVFLSRAKGDNTPAFSVRSFGNALSMYPSSNPYINSDFATSTAIFAITSDNNSQYFTKLTNFQAQKAYSQSPGNFLIIRKLVNSYTFISPGNPEYEKQGGALAQKLIILSPTDPQSYFTAAKFYAAVGNKKLAMSNLKRSLVLKPDFVEAQDLLSQIER